MKVIGILGGLSPESTGHYYGHIIRSYHERKGDHDYPEIIVYSVNFEKYIKWQEAGDWSAAAEDMINVFNKLKNAGAEFGIIATNTMHKVFDVVSAYSPIPLVSIMEATGERIKAEGFNKVGLIGTIYTMKEGFYQEALGESGIEVIVPEDADQDYINNVIYNELTIGDVKDESRAKFVEVVKKLEADGAKGVILGCTEIPMLISEADCGLKLFNTTEIHAEKALEEALS
jgi:aspartate racemase